MILEAEEGSGARRADAGGGEDMVGQGWEEGREGRRKVELDVFEVGSCLPRRRLKLEQILQHGLEVGSVLARQRRD